MRMFLALVPPPKALHAVERAIHPLRQQRPQLRWAAPATWHLTLVFLGNVTETQCDQLRRALPQQLAGHAPLSLAVHGAGVFPAAVERARVLWLGVRGDTEALERLVDALRDAAQTSDIAVQNRKYHPHLTVARSRRPTDMRGALAGLDTVAGDSWTATEVRLLHSTLGPRGPHYRTVSSWALT
ncbi:RNA 2',3'-cyclic phosphodiesterase [Lipingzhangella sp. LS1_29]|uniref:RNA 2',3'-cyclic phosphodiesterase n=2 Tax=Lipingzhangella rawalii TaxID=2055835 RepID=A0ABU2H4G2_9ACTN|nr:RNA 2',3'-cyclic phosphodiesterase [Lipingzhangella rawalii]